MQYVSEAVVTARPEGGYVATFPGWDGITATGETLGEVVKHAVEALSEEASQRLDRHEELPPCTFDAPVPEGAEKLIISFDALPASVSLLLTASDASVVLGVTRSRISNMLRAGILEEGHRDGRSTVVTLKSVNHRLANPRRPGRPKKAGD